MENNENSLNESRNTINNKRITTSIKKNIYFILLAFLVVIIVIIAIWYKKEKDVKVTEASKGNFEIYTETKAYVLNKETLVNYNKNETLIPIAESEKRITVGSVIGIYKNSEYEKGLSELAKMDEEINQKLELLPEVYSNEVISIDKEIDEVSKEIKNISSYIEMGDYKSKLDKLAYNKALTVSGLTPSGSDVKSLILKRDQYRDSMNKSSNNIKAPISGIILYSTDGLENKFETKDIGKLPATAIDQLINEYDKTKDETFGIKIVDNYESYIIIKEDKSNDKYITEGRIYTIELLDKRSKIKGTLIKKTVTDNYNYCVFKITNNIEEIADLREADVKVIWKQLNGYVINNTSIKTVNNINYVTILSLNKYIDIPVKNLLRLDNISLVDNYTTDEKTNLNLSETRTLEIYDRVVESK